MEHEFGGQWTRTKIEILGEYLSIYSNAMKNQPFRLHYVDAFAGTGTHRQKSLDTQAALIPLEDMEGSVKTALNVYPGFDEYHFNDLNPAHVEALNEIRTEFPEKNINVTQDDANNFIPTFCSNLRGKDRVVLFIDPYNTEFNWETLQVIAQSKKVDMWLLFPISVILRMTPKEGAKIIPEWDKTISRLLGTPGWKEALYKPKEPQEMGDLFATRDILSESDELMERINPDELKSWVHLRLEEIFSYVASPVMLKNNNRPLFLLFFAVSNPSPAAKKLASRLAKHSMDKFS